MIDELALLTAAEAREVVETLDAIRPAWLVRDTRAFATLGRAAYLDLCGGKGTIEEYRACAADQNDHLRRAFGDLLEAVRTEVEKQIQQPAVLTTEWALPGFHIFTGPGLRGAGAGGAHFDLQFRELIGGADIAAARVLSFTLALELPAAGSGLRVWPIRPAQLHGSSSARDGGERLGEYLARKPSVYIRYEVGTLYLQPEPILHCIWNGAPISDSDRRITLQGHGLEQDGTIVLYW
jgi:hypothetical protein